MLAASRMAAPVVGVLESAEVLSPLYGAATEPVIPGAPRKSLPPLVLDNDNDEVRVYPPVDLAAYEDKSKKAYRSMLREGRMPLGEAELSEHGGVCPKCCMGPATHFAGSCMVCRQADQLKAMIAADRQAYYEGLAARFGQAGDTLQQTRARIVSANPGITLYESRVPTPQLHSLTRVLVSLCKACPTCTSKDFLGFRGDGFDLCRACRGGLCTAYAVQVRTANPDNVSGEKLHHMIAKAAKDNVTNIAGLLKEDWRCYGCLEPLDELDEEDKDLDDARCLTCRPWCEICQQDIAKGSGDYCVDCQHICIDGTHCGDAGRSVEPGEVCQLCTDVNAFVDTVEAYCQAAGGRPVPHVEIKAILAKDAKLVALDGGVDQLYAGWRKRCSRCHEGPQPVEARFATADAQVCMACSQLKRKAETQGAR